MTLKRCKELGIKVGFITTTTPKTINIIKEGLSNFLNFEDFDLITSSEKVSFDKPNPEVYKFALKDKVHLEIGSQNYLKSKNGIDGLSLY